MKTKYPKIEQEIRVLAEGGRILHDILRETAARVKPGISTADLDGFAKAAIIKAGGRPSFIGYGEPGNPFPSALCTSVNDVVVHGIPSREIKLADGDIVGLDIGMEYKGLYTDTAVTVPVGPPSAAAGRLINTAKMCLGLAVDAARVGNKIGDISYAIQSTAEKEGFSVVRDLVGHGVGYAVHEEPAVPCYGKPGTGLPLLPGMVLAIEPMICEKDWRVAMDDDGWTIRTRDRGFAAHFEHTVAIGPKGAQILT